MTGTPPIHLDTGNFGLNLAAQTTTIIAACLKLTFEDRVAMEKMLHPVIAAMGSQIIQPVLIDAIMEKYGAHVTMQQNVDVRKAAQALIGAHLAHAILPDLEKPGLLKNDTAYQAALADIAEGLSATSKEEIIQAISSLIPEVFTSPQRPAIAPSFKDRHQPRKPIEPIDISPDEQRRILSTVSLVRVLNEKTVVLEFNHDKLEAKGYSDNGFLSEELKGKLSLILSEIAGTSIDYTAHSGDRTRQIPPSIYYDVSPALSSAMSVNDIAEKIFKEIQHAQSPQGRSLS